MHSQLNFHGELKKAALVTLTNQIILARDNALIIVGDLVDQLSPQEYWGACADLAEYSRCTGRALLREKRKSRRRHWSYDANHHIALRRAKAAQSMALVELIARTIAMAANNEIKQQKSASQ